MSSSVGRRSFVQKLSSLIPASLLTVGEMTPHGAAAGESENAPDWLARLRRSPAPLFLDVASFRADAGHLTRALDYLDITRASSTGVHVVLGVHAEAIAYLLGDRVWDEWDLRARFNMRNSSPGTGNPFDHAMRNGTTLNALRDRQVLLLACRNTIAHWATARQAAVGGIADDHARLMLENLVPGAIVVPSMVSAAADAQRRGVPYVFSV
jgi:intracellular sulfur oxidation DsrE/DsrF family protein